MAAKSKLRRTLRWAVVLGLLGGAIFGFCRYHLKRYDVVREGVLIRVAQPTELGLKFLIRWKGVRTVINLRRESDDPLHRNLLDPGDPNGRTEPEQVERLGACSYHWPMGGEAYWPWLPPWHYESFFALFDNPANHPVAIHCMGGRHRTGAFSALYRLEYDLWPAEKAIEEMYSFDFGARIPIVDHNLRTYTPRPRPSDQQWQELQKTFSAQKTEDYAALVRRLRGEVAKKNSATLTALRKYINEDRPFALPLAQRLLDKQEHPLREEIASNAVKKLQNPQAEFDVHLAAAAVVADFGEPAQREVLLKLLNDEPKTGQPSLRYQALAAGVMNRYTVNRLAYLQPLLADKRVRPGFTRPTPYRFCDSAAAHLESIVDVRLVSELPPTTELWDDSLRQAQAWFRQHPGAADLISLQLPSGEHYSRLAKQPEAGKAR